MALEKNWQLVGIVPVIKIIQIIFVIWITSAAIAISCDHA